MDNEKQEASTEVTETEANQTSETSFEDRFAALEAKVLGGGKTDTKEDDGRLSFDDVKKAYPCASDIAIKKALSHNDYDPARILRIAKASHSDGFNGEERGEARATKRFADELKSMRDSLESEVQKRIAEQLNVLKAEQTDAWGSPPSQSTTGGEGTISYDEFKQLSIGKSDAEVQALMKKVRWSPAAPPPHK